MNHVCVSTFAMRPPRGGASVCRLPPWVPYLHRQQRSCSHPGWEHQYSCVCVNSGDVGPAGSHISIQYVCQHSDDPPPWGPRMSTSIMWTPRGPASVPVRRSFAMHSPVYLILAVHLAPCLFVAYFHGDTGAFLGVYLTFHTLPAMMVIWSTTSLHPS
jgi:hypothetical protein